MATCGIKNWQGETVGSTELDLPVARPETASHLLYLAVRRQMMNARQGNAHTKTRSEVRGGGRKPWRQKGTGRARAGSIRSPLWRKGGVIFGPRKREFNIAMNRKERRLALRTAFQSRAEDLIVVQEFSEHIEIPKTREVAQALLRWGVAMDQSALVIVEAKTQSIERAIRNIARVKLTTIHHLSVFDLLNVDWVVITQPALEQLKQMWDPNAAAVEVEAVEAAPAAEATEVATSPEVSVPSGDQGEEPGDQTEPTTAEGEQP